MGACCCKGDASIRNVKHDEGRTLRIMFRKLDSDKKGYISTEKLKDLLRDDRINIGEKGADYIMEKYGTDGKMSEGQFKVWWRSTSSLFNDDSIVQSVNEAEAGSGRRGRFSSAGRMDSIIEGSCELPDNPMTKISRS